jgi:tRNA pseudouridine38-40 synthase
VQGVLEAAFEEVTGEQVRVNAAGRTDAGVHARGQVAHLDCAAPLELPELQRALNAVLPCDVAVLALSPAAADFNARRDAQGKRYVYRILNRPEPSPLRAGRVWHLRTPLDVVAMRRAAGAVLGSHDFAAFRGTHGGSPDGEQTRRSIDQLDVEKAGDELRIICEGRSFLRYMVRNLVGTLVEIGQGRRPPEAMSAILAGGERAAAGPTAPAHGLCLEHVTYRPDD